MIGDRVPETPQEIIFKQLARYLGPSTAKTALRTFCEKTCKKPPEQLTNGEAISLLAALRPMLRTLLGVGESDQVLARLTRELGT
jgi:hypothetical protein